MALDTKQEEHRDAVIRGHEFSVHLDRPRVVRIFLSSTFKDFIVERDHLFNNALPTLDKWCAARGLEFQVVDLRWGIKDHAVLDHGGANLCIKEVEHCQRHSIGPNFVAFVGDRYGHRPLPKSIQAQDYTNILQCSGSDKNKLLISDNYQMDANVVPPVYVLRNQPDANNNGEEPEVSRDLRRVLAEAVQTAHTKGVIKHTHPYTASVTEQEIWQGILDVPNPDQTTLCFVRNFKSLRINPELLDDTVVFADYVPPLHLGQRDPIATSMLEEMKSKALPSKLKPKHNLFEFTLEFSPEGGVEPVMNAAHHKYLHKFEQLFLSKLQEQIQHALDDMKEDKYAQDSLYQEIAKHAQFSLTKTRFFCGQSTETFDELHAFLQKPTDKLLALQGPSGVGKTATVAKLVQGVWMNLLGVPNVLYRFLGTTPTSSRLDMLLTSITMQIDQMYKFPSSAPTTAVEALIDKFHTQIDKLKQLGQHVPPLYIVLDSLDQLAPAHNAHTLHWLPRQLPSNVRVFVSCMMEAETIWTHINQRTVKDNIFTLKQISNDSATKALVGLLSSQGRTLQYEQLEHVKAVFEHTQNPLFLHLTAVEASRWHSYTDKSKLRLGKTLIEAVNVLFDRLEVYHGKMLVSRALAYVVIAKQGVTEQEMEEILSLDNDVLDEVYEHWMPPSPSDIQIPQLVWTRLKQDMHDFIMTRQGLEGHAVMSIYHKQFTDVIQKRYLADETTRLQLHSILREFFAGEYGNNRPKAATLRIYHNIERALARHVRAQPMKHAHDRWNRRKLLCLPYHTLECDPELYMSDVVYNWEWWDAQINAHSLDALKEDVIMALKYVDDEQRAPVQQLVNIIGLCRSTDVLDAALHLVATLPEPDHSNNGQHQLLAGARKALIEAHKKMLLPRQALIPLNSTMIYGEHTEGLIQAVCCGSVLLLLYDTTIILYNVENMHKTTLQHNQAICIVSLGWPNVLVLCQTSAELHNLLNHSAHNNESAVDHHGDSNIGMDNQQSSVQVSVQSALNPEKDRLIVVHNGTIILLQCIKDWVKKPKKEDKLKRDQWTIQGMPEKVAWLDKRTPCIVMYGELYVLQSDKWIHVLGNIFAAGHGQLLEHSTTNTNIHTFDSVKQLVKGKTEAQRLDIQYVDQCYIAHPVLCVCTGNDIIVHGEQVHSNYIPHTIMALTISNENTREYIATVDDQHNLCIYNEKLKIVGLMSGVPYEHIQFSGQYLIAYNTHTVLVYNTDNMKSTLTDYNTSIALHTYRAVCKGGLYLCCNTYLQYYNTNDTTKPISSHNLEFPPSAVFHSSNSGQLIYDNIKGQLRVYSQLSDTSKSLADLSSQVLSSCLDESDTLYVITDKQLLLSVHINTGTVTNVQRDKSNYIMSAVYNCPEGVIIVDDKNAIHEHSRNGKHTLLRQANTDSILVVTSCGQTIAYCTETSVVVIDKHTKSRILPKNVRPLQVAIHQSNAVLIGCDNCIMLWDYINTQDIVQLYTGTPCIALYTNDGVLTTLMANGTTAIIDVTNVILNRRSSDYNYGNNGSAKSNRSVSKFCVLL